MSHYSTTHAAVVTRQGNDESAELEPSPARALIAELLPLAQEAAAACRRHETRQRERERWTENTVGGASESDVAELWPEAELLTELGLVQRIQAALLQRPGQLAALEAYCDYGLTDWVADWVFEAAQRGHLQTAVALFDAWDELRPELPAEQLGSKARLLLCGQQLEAAKAALEARLVREPDSLEALEVAADIYQECGDLAAAERHARRYVDVARGKGDIGDLRYAMYTLADILLDRGKLDAAREVDEEADALLLAEEDQAESEFLFNEEHDPHCQFCNTPAHWQPARQPVVRAQPKIGRNQSCPCGSGAKYKKCCGR